MMRVSYNIGTWTLVSCCVCGFDFARVFIWFEEFSSVLICLVSFVCLVFWAVRVCFGFTLFYFV